MHWARENEEDALTTFWIFSSLSRCSKFFHTIIIIQNSNYIFVSTRALNAYWVLATSVYCLQLHTKTLLTSPLNPNNSFTIADNQICIISVLLLTMSPSNYFNHH